MRPWSDKTSGLHAASPPAWALGRGRGRGARRRRRQAQAPPGAGAARRRRRQAQAPPGAPMKHRCRCGDSNVSSVSLVTRREEGGPGRRLGPVGGLGHVGVRCGRGVAVARKRDLRRFGGPGRAGGRGGGGPGRGRVGAGGGLARWGGRLAEFGWGGLGLDYYGDDHGAAAVVVADPLADDAAG
jgi:hypothetical protein